MPSPRIIDLTLTLGPGMRGFETEPKFLYERDGWNASTLHLYAHCGTHMDAQVHFEAGPETIDQIPPERCLGRAWLVNLTGIAPKALIDISSLGAAAADFQPGDSLLLRTDWSKQVAPARALEAAAASPASSRDANWRDDLRFLVRCIKDIHARAFWQTSEAEFDSLVALVDQRIPELGDAEIAVEFVRIAALVRDGHGGVDVSPVLDSGRLYPVRVYPFQDGVHVIAAAPEYAEHVGSRVEGIGGLPVQEALDRVMQVLGGENEYTRLNWAPLFLVQPRLLRVLGFSETEERIRLAGMDIRLSSRLFTRE